MRSTRRDIPPERKGLYTFGLVLQGAGVVGIVVCFLGFAIAGRGAVARGPTAGGVEGPFDYWIGILVCMFLAAGGGFVRRVAARGVAGSGLVLDPERAREDLEPWARMGGGMVRDALDEAGLSQREEPRPQDVRVRCRSCRTLNDEDAKFCDHCGAEL